MKTPKIIFRYSEIYDKRWKVHFKNESYPTGEEITRYTKDIETIWERKEKEILEEMSNITGLDWYDETIICYIVGICRPFSDPLTIGIYFQKYRDKEDFIDVLVHELIHQLFTQKDNFIAVKRYIDELRKQHKGLSETALLHIPLHAIHQHIYNDLFDVDRLQRDKELSKQSIDYDKSWEEVEKQGYKNIIKELKKKHKVKP
ncbi:MAG: hypothetical protein ACP5OA_00350 [Candidatus Woesearchaeota archaeon]